MNRLQLVQRLWLEAGASGTSPGPSTTLNQPGESARLVTWIDAAWTDIQNAHSDWDWSRTSTSFATVASQSVYPLGTGAGTCEVAASAYGEWARNTARCYQTSVGTNSEIFLNYITYAAWRNRYQYGSTRANDVQPTEFAIAPDKSICLPPALAGYTCTLDYFTAPTAMTADADVPALPAQFHMAIVYRAMMSYGAYESASEVYDRGELEFGKLMRRLDEQRLPEVTWG